MLHKIAEARAARTDPDLVIIARTNARRAYDLDEALRRAEAFHKAGADMLFVHTRSADELRIVGERLPPPLMMFAPPDGFNGFALSPRDLAGLGYRLAASSGTAFAAMYKAVRQSYECLARGEIDPFLGRGGADKEMKAAHETSGARPSLDHRTANHEGPLTGHRMSTTTDTMTLSHDVRAANQCGGAQGRPDQLAAGQARLRGREGREHHVQGDRARPEIRRGRAGDRDLPAGQGLRQTLCPAAGGGARARPASHHRLQPRARAARALRPQRQARRRARLYADDRRLGARHP